MPTIPPAKVFIDKMKAIPGYVPQAMQQSVFGAAVSGALEGASSALSVAGGIASVNEAYHGIRMQFNPAARQRGFRKTTLSKGSIARMREESNRVVSHMKKLQRLKRRKLTETLLQ